MFGGMFDPPHLGHLIIASETVWQLGLDELRLVPTARPPHREPGWLAPEMRLRLVAAATDGFPGLSASRIELDRPGPSYSVDTLAEVAAEEPDAELWLVIGADQLVSFDRWRDPNRILSLARLAVVARDGTDSRDADEAIAAVGPDRVDRVWMPTVAISSTLIRERIRAGAPFRHLVPAAVHDILVAESLSREQSTLP